MFTKLDRVAYPEELTFLFMKIIDDIAVKLSIDDRMEEHRKANKRNLKLKNISTRQSTALVIKKINTSDN